MPPPEPALQNVRPAPTAPTADAPAFEVTIDHAARAGDVLRPLASLLVELARRGRSAAGVVCAEVGTASTKSPNRVAHKEGVRR
jgi:hypothetical protein